jgi:AcrR family transcriptional regulator
MRTSLWEQNKAERRQRILAAARRLISKKGFEGLTMRDLADAARVSVPTVYNLVGGKVSLLAALVEEVYANVVAKLGDPERHDTFVSAAMELCAVGHGEVLLAPEYYRELIGLFLVSKEARPIRKSLAERNIALMARVVASGQARGEIVDWVDPVALSATLYSQYTSATIDWANRKLDDDALQATTSYGHALILLGVARGRAVAKLEALARMNQHAARPATAVQSKKGARSR